MEELWLGKAEQWRRDGDCLGEASPPRCDRGCPVDANFNTTLKSVPAREKGVVGMDKQKHSPSAFLDSPCLLWMLAFSNGFVRFPKGLTWGTYLGDLPGCLDLGFMGWSMLVEKGKGYLGMKPDALLPGPVRAACFLVMCPFWDGASVQGMIVGVESRPRPCFAQMVLF